MTGNKRSDEKRFAEYEIEWLKYIFKIKKIFTNIPKVSIKRINFY